MMKGTCLLVTGIVLGLFLSLNGSEARAQGCSGSTLCVLVNFPSEEGRKPETNPDLLRVKRDVRQQIGNIRFIVAGAPARNVYVQFKNCPGSDCRTPFVDADGDPLWKLNLRHGRPQDFPIGDWLGGCDHECALNDEECIVKKCKYSYSVFADRYEELDPDIVVDPK